MTAGRSVIRTVLGYGAMIAAAALLFLWIRGHGERLVAPAGGTPAAAAHSGAGFDTLLHVLLALIVVIVAARAVGAVFRRIGQPPVMGEVVAGLLLGPSFLGRAWPAGYDALLPPAVAPHLQVIAQIGVILYMFLVGVELDTSRLSRGAHTALAISHASIVVPFLLGAALALGLYPRLSHAGVSFTAFALFLGVSMSVTAFPVLARILTDRGAQSTPIGVMALTCAAVDDVSAWCLLALVMGVLQSRSASVIPTLAMTVAFVGLVLIALRPLMRRVAVRVEASPRGASANAMALVFVVLLGAALATEWIGIHALFGAFLVGVVIPHDGRLARDLRARLEDLVVVLLLPAFFAFSGMRTRLQLLSGAEHWLWCGLIVVVACAGKLGGTTVAARLTGSSWRDSAALGILMNTRGLVELIVLNVGLDHGVISPTLFAMLVIMALVTTLATSPVFDAIVARGSEGVSARAPVPLSRAAG